MESERSATKSKRPHYRGKKTRSWKSIDSTSETDKLDIFSERGVVCMRLSRGTQIALGCEVGQDLTPKTPWIRIARNKVLEDLLMNGEDSEFLTVREDIRAYETDELLIGYDPSSDDENVCYLCVNSGATDCVLTLLDMKKKERQEKLERALFKTAGNWPSLGSEYEVEELMTRCSRSLYVVEAETREADVLIQMDLEAANSRDLHGGLSSFPSAGEEKSAAVPRLRDYKQTQTPTDTETKSVQTWFDGTKNMYTDYDVQFQELKDNIQDKDLGFRINDAIKLNIMDFMENELEYNASFNLYENDYENLVLHKDDTFPIQEKCLQSFEVYSDVKNCKGLCVSCVSWNPKYPNIVAVAFAPSTRWNLVTKDVNESGDGSFLVDSVFSKKFVLIWKLTNTFTPKLYLESPQYVNTVSFCPYNESIIVGGLVNGQVAIWDIAGRIEKVEKKLCLSPTQIIHHTLMGQHIDWIRLKSVSIVEPAVLSSCRFSHIGCITKICWIDWPIQVRKNGKVCEVPPEKQSIQFFTASEDGTINVWDLFDETSLQTGIYKHKRKTKARQRPDTLKAEESWLRPLYRLFQPVFQLSVATDQDGARLPISEMLSEIPSLSYEKKRMETLDEKFMLELDFRVVTVKFDLSQEVQQKTEVNLTDPKDMVFDDLMKLYFEIKLIPRERQANESLICGTTLGQTTTLTWEQFDTSVKKALITQTCKFQHYSTVHDGPICVMDRSPLFPQAHFSVGGRVIAVWYEQQQDCPVFCYRGNSVYTSACWSYIISNVIVAITIDGWLELWDLNSSFTEPYHREHISGDTLTGVYGHPVMSSSFIFMYTDGKGRVRLIQRFTQSRYEMLTECGALEKLCKAEVKRKEQVKTLIEKWRPVKRKSVMRRRADSVMRDTLEAPCGDRQQADDETSKKKGRARDGDFARTCRIREDRRLINQVLKRKKLDNKSISQMHSPLFANKNREEERKNKRRQRLEEMGDSFNKTMMRLFQGKQTTKILKHEISLEKDIDRQKEFFVQGYLEQEQLLTNYVKLHPCAVEFNWHNTLMGVEEMNAAYVRDRNVFDVRDCRPILYQRKEVPEVEITDDESSLSEEQIVEEEDLAWKNIENEYILEETGDNDEMEEEEKEYVEDDARLEIK